MTDKNFWAIQKPLKPLNIRPRKPQEASALLKIVKEAPFAIGKRNLTHYFEEMYFRISESALKKSFSE